MMIGAQKSARGQVYPWDDKWVFPLSPFRVCVSFFGLFLLSLVTNAADKPTRAEIEETAKWFNSLQWPDARGKEYVEVTFGKTVTTTETVDGPKVRGILLHEDEKGFTLLSDGTLGLWGNRDVNVWPSIAANYIRWADADFKTEIRRMPLEEAVREVLSDIKAVNEAAKQSFIAIPGLSLSPHPGPPTNQPFAAFDRNFGRKISDEAAVFLLARICAWQDRKDLAEQLEAQIPQVPPTSRRGHGSNQETFSFRSTIEQDLAHVAMWKAVNDFSDLEFSRPELLTQFERIIRDFPGSEHVERAKSFSELLKQMIEEDRVHAAKGVALEALPPEERVKELIFQLRDQNGYQWRQPGSCDIFQGRTWAGGKGTTPAHQLVDLGHAAVPALIQALTDRRLSRSVGYHRDFYFSHFVLTVGDCAEAILSQIAGRSFWSPQTTFAAMQKDGQTNATRTAVEEWWMGVQNKGEKAILEEGVRAGTGDSIEQARRLATLDHEGAVPAIIEGIKSANSEWVQAALINVLGGVQSDSSTQALWTQLKECKSLKGRVAAARGLLRRGDHSAIPPMIEEMKNWKAPEKNFHSVGSGTADDLIEFLTSSNDPAAIRVLDDQFARFPVRTKMEVIRKATDAITTDNHPLAPKKLHSPEVHEAVEALLIRALDDRTLNHGAMGRHGDVEYREPRVCDIAFLELTSRWPERYPFDWARTRFERDRQMALARDVWRKGNGLPAAPMSERPTHTAAVQNHNVLASLEWVGEPLVLPVSIGQPLIAKSVVSTLAQLYSGMPTDCRGFIFSLERPPDGMGAVMRIEWVKGRREHQYDSNFHVDVSLNGKSLYAGGVTGGSEHRPSPREYGEEERAIADALKSDLAHAVTIYYTANISE